MERWLALPGILCLIVAATGQAFSYSGMQLGVVSTPAGRVLTGILGAMLLVLSLFAEVGGSESQPPGPGQESSDAEAQPLATPVEAVARESQTNRHIAPLLDVAIAATTQRAPRVAQPDAIGSPRFQVEAGVAGTSSDRASTSRAAAPGPLVKLVQVEADLLTRLHELQAQLFDSITSYMDYGDLAIGCVRLRARLEAVRSPQEVSVDWPAVREPLEDFRRRTSGSVHPELRKFVVHLKVAIDAVAAMMQPQDNEPATDAYSVIQHRLLPAIRGMLQEAEDFNEFCKARSKTALADIREIVGVIFHTVPAAEPVSREKSARRADELAAGGPAAALTTRETKRR
jgi:hypothetical protein